MNVGYGGQWKFLTFINLYIQFTVFSLAVMQILAAAIGMPSASKKLKELKETVYAALGAPICLFVVSSFWILYSLDRQFIYPSHMDNIVPFWTTHFFHTTIVVILLQPYFDKIVYPARKTGIFVLMSFNISYFAWISFICYQSGEWPYPFLNALSPVGFAIFALATFALSVCLYIFGEKVNAMNNPATIELKNK